jgi:hypothetical protein
MPFPYNLEVLLGFVFSDYTRKIPLPRWPLFPLPGKKMPKVYPILKNLENLGSLGKKNKK